VMLGAIIGDIIGSRFEFNNHRSTDFELFTADCSFTDDTICTIAIADALPGRLPESQPSNSEDFAESLRKWCRKYPNPQGGYGGNFARWVQSDNPQPYNSFGNGSAMRVSPCAWFSKDENSVLEAARQSALCTHNHPEGVRGALCVAHCIYSAWVLRYSKKEISHLVTAKYGYKLDMSCDAIRTTNRFNETCQVTVPQAIQCFLESSDFESAIRLAVSIGGDTDTIAAITGSIAEGFYYEIPTDVLLTARTYLPEEMIDVINDFYYYYLGEPRAFK